MGGGALRRHRRAVRHCGVTSQRIGRAAVQPYVAMRWSIPVAMVGLLFTSPWTVSAGIGAPCPGQGLVATRNIPYRSVPGVDPRLLSLDLYRPVVDAGCPPAPVMIWVHGGGWSAGDKANNIDNKVRWLTGNGWVLVAVNYRLSPYPIPERPSGLDPDRVTWPIHGQDVAAAVAWVRDHIGSYGGDPSRISLMGHSSGAQIVSAIATDPSFLQVYGMGPEDLSHCISLDTATYDIPWRMEQLGPSGRMMLLNAFGTDPSVWSDASPVNHVTAGRCLPPFFIVVEGPVTRLAQAHRFAATLREAGVRAVLLETPALSHSGVNHAIGDPGDRVITPALAWFLGMMVPVSPPCPGPRDPARHPQGSSRTIGP